MPSHVTAFRSRDAVKARVVSDPQDGLARRSIFPLLESMYGPARSLTIHEIVYGNKVRHHGVDAP
jgi:uncharacterized protein YggU (UPF0235/DUF167 family)